MDSWPPPGINWYYHDDYTCIAHGDCRDILPKLPKVDLVLTDPPYGINYDPSKHKNHKALNMIGDDKPFNPTFLLSFSYLILWGADCYSKFLPNGSGWLVWTKTKTDGNDACISDAELAWTNCIKRTRVFNCLWSGYYRESEQGEYYHPTQKPIRLIRWCIDISRRTGLILDPFMGSGTTLVAAKQLKRKAIGIEIEKKYCDIAIERLRQEVLPFT